MLIYFFFFVMIKRKKINNSIETKTVKHFIIVFFVISNVSNKINDSV